VPLSPLDDEAPNHKHQIADKDQTEREQIPNGKPKETPAVNHVASCCLFGTSAVLPFGPCLLFGACDLVLVLWDRGEVEVRRAAGIHDNPLQKAGRVLYNSSLGQVGP
jgi:hypothetical protein